MDLSPLRIRELILTGLQAKGMSVAELSRRSGVHKATIFRAIEENPSSSPTARTLQKLLRALDISVDDPRWSERRPGTLVKASEGSPKAYNMSERELTLSLTGAVNEILIVSVLDDIETKFGRSFLIEVESGIEGNPYNAIAHAVSSGIIAPSDLDIFRTIQNIRERALEEGDAFSLVTAINSTPRPPALLQQSEGLTPLAARRSLLALIATAAGKLTQWAEMDAAEVTAEDSSNGTVAKTR